MIFWEHLAITGFAAVSTLAVYFASLSYVSGRGYEREIGQLTQRLRKEQQRADRLQDTVAEHEETIADQYQRLLRIRNAVASEEVDPAVADQPRKVHGL